jgi:acyl-[acyl-carrier-protein]--UDP-N-acetylglucosamine O-acyltransferase
MISNLAYVHPEAKIGENVTIEPFATVYKDVVIGDGTWIGPNTVIMDGARIGKKCRIFPGAIIAGIPQDLKFAGEDSIAQIGDNTTVRECATVNRGTKSKGKTVVGSNCLLMAYSHIAHDCLLGDYVIIGNGTQLAGEVEIDDHAILSAHVLVHQFTRIGQHVIISGGSHVLKDVPHYVKAAREPLSYVGLNVVGLRRRSFSPEKIQEIQTIYRYLYQSSMNNKAAVKHIEETMPQTPERDLVVSFVKESKRGIMKGFMSEIDDE